RRPHADPRAEDRCVRVPRPVHGRLMTDIEPRTDGVLEWTSAPAPESRAIVSFEERYGLYIGGETVEPRSGEWFTSISPASEEPLAGGAPGGPEDGEAAVRA